MEERPNSNHATRTERLVAAIARKPWKTSAAKFQSSLMSRLICALSVTADVEAFYLGSYRILPAAIDITSLRDTEKH
jgi:hypothetical protein